MLSKLRPQGARVPLQRQAAGLRRRAGATGGSSQGISGHDARPGTANLDIDPATHEQVEQLLAKFADYPKAIIERTKLAVTR